MTRLEKEGKKKKAAVERSFVWMGLEKKDLLFGWDLVTILGPCILGKEFTSATKEKLFLFCFLFCFNYNCECLGQLTRT